MAYRDNKNSEWVGTLSYNFTQPISKSRGVSNPLKVALILANGETPKTRKEILKKIGAKGWDKPGNMACMFTALNWNKVIEWDKKEKCYKKGDRFLEYMQYTLELITKQKLKSKHKKVYLTILKNASNAAHFIVTD